jgi:hypothetical protein
MLAFLRSLDPLRVASVHQSAGHPMIVIQVPTVSSFPDQDFLPPQK